MGNPTGLLRVVQACDLAGVYGLMPILLEVDRVYDADGRMIGSLQQAWKTIAIPSKKNRKTQQAYDQWIFTFSHSRR